MGVVQADLIEELTSKTVAILSSSASLELIADEEALRVQRK